ncbi:HutD family protein [Aestuariivirga sp.]|uniref:HutD/Ves family protein n=1 Tax=Aestuariivirga sp. TaxID=2650926 RepID=UPI0039E2754F
MALTVLPAQGFREGRWLNGLGVSWDIASDPHGAGFHDFNWRFAIARIDSDVPFSAYEKVDRVFMLLDGDGLDLDVAGHGRIAVGEANRPVRFPGDAPTHCTLRGGPCRALNLFLARGKWTAVVSVHRGGTPITHQGLSLLFALKGETLVDGLKLHAGDAALLHGSSRAEGDGLLYVADLSPAGA